MDTFHNATNTFFKIKEGMDVYNVDYEKIGTVKFVQFPSSESDPNIATFPYDLQYTGLNAEMAYRLLQSGFVSVKAGWWARDWIVMPEQIDFVTNDKVHLTVTERDLSKV